MTTLTKHTEECSACTLVDRRIWGHDKPHVTRVQIGAACPGGRGIDPAIQLTPDGGVDLLFTDERVHALCVLIEASFPGSDKPQRLWLDLWPDPHGVGVRGAVAYEVGFVMGRPMRHPDETRPQDA